MTRYTILTSATAVFLLFPMLSFAQVLSGDAGEFGTAVGGFSDLINNFLIPLLIALAVLAFVYGVFQYFILGGADEEKRKSGRQLMLYSLFGFLAIIALWGIVLFLVEGFFGSSEFNTPNTPEGPQISPGG